MLLTRVDNVNKENAMSLINKYTIHIPQADLDDLKTRLKKVRYTSEITPHNDDMGLGVKYIKDLVDYWQNDYDWRSVEKKLNQIPQFQTTIDGQNIHFVHVESPVEGATPLLLTHGWPTTFVEYTELIGKLTNPVAYGGKKEDAFHVVIPSLPGFGLSGMTTDVGWNRYRIAKAWAELMQRLGYEHYIAAGNDVGSLVSPEVGRLDAKHVLGVHVTQVFSFPSGDPRELERLNDEEKQQLKILQWFEASMNGYQKLQQTKPQNIAHALADSPIAQLAWSSQLFGEAVSKEFIITNVTLYWLTNTGGSAARLYYEDAHAEVPTDPTTMPLGLSNFGFDFQSIRTFAERDHKNIVFWKKHQEGGHFSAQMTPDLLVADLREFARLVQK
jgi:pimeloyl-ACP methyl ester carboxylesterase